MPSFLDGPAQDEDLPLTRAPRFLRVVQNGPVIATLEQLNSEPDPTDLIYVYQIHGHPTENPHKAAIATYQLLPRQPTDPEIRETEDWRHWTLQQPRS
jgi:hypothetical protein